MVIRDWREELRHLSEEDQRRQLVRRINQYADSGCGECLLAEPPFARLVQESLFHNDGLRYDLRAWVVMPNHVHVLLAPFSEASLSSIVQALKGFTPKEIGKHIGRKGQIWQEDYFDRFVRNDAHLVRLVRYIEYNPVKARLCPDPVLFSWSSANANARTRLEYLRSTRAADQRSADP